MSDFASNMPRRRATASPAPSLWHPVWLAAAAAVAWAALAGSVLLTPHARPTGVSGYAVAVALWFVMMVAMMLPALWQWLTLFGAMASRAYPGRRSSIVVAEFVAGYFAVWLGYAAVAAAMQGGLHELALLRLDLTLGAGAGGVVLLLAGIFQLTPLKGACLRHCRNPLSFFLARWDDGPAGPFRMGSRHGAFCVACCWALMALSFVLGIMNLLWMAVITVIVVAEQHAPSRWRLQQAFGLVLTAWGTILLLSG